MAKQYRNVMVKLETANILHDLKHIKKFRSLELTIDFLLKLPEVKKLLKKGK